MCEPIFISQCTSQPYPNTGFPNFFNQSHQAAADEIDHLIDIVVSYSCSKQTTEFLCGLLLPECRENEGLVLPRKQACKEFYAGCGTILKETGNENAIIDCDKHFSDTPEPICPAQPTVPTTKEATTHPFVPTTRKATTIHPFVLTTKKTTTTLQFIPTTKEDTTRHPSVPTTEEGNCNSSICFNNNGSNYKLFICSA